MYHTLPYCRVSGMTKPIERVDPPAPRIKHLDVAAWLKEHPGEWAKVATGETPVQASNWVQRIRTGRLVAFRPAGAYAARQQGDTVIASYVGGVDQ